MKSPIIRRAVTRLVFMELTDLEFCFERAGIKAEFIEGEDSERVGHD
jgi:hypothetical protein